MNTEEIINKLQENYIEAQAYLLFVNIFLLTQTLTQNRKRNVTFSMMLINFIPFISSFTLKEIANRFPPNNIDIVTN